MGKRSTPDPVARFDWAQTRRYWERHQELRGHADLDADPHALANVCLSGSPTWLNERHAGEQKAVFERLLDRVPHGGGRALDIGCGGGRWSELLSGRGWEVTGIDLQETLIESNRRRLPHIRFERVALQDFEPEKQFSFACSVTVLGHIPHAIQPQALARLHSITDPGSRILVLENVIDQEAHVFSNSVGGWTALFREAGFECEAVVPYDFHPCMRALTAVRRTSRRNGGSGGRVEPDEYMVSGDGEAARLTTAAKRAYWALMRAACVVDQRLDLFLTRRPLGVLPPAHAGMLFVRV